MNKQEIRQKLFNYLYGEYGISLMESDYNEINYIIQSLTKPTDNAEELKNEAIGFLKYYFNNSDGSLNELELYNEYLKQK